MTENLFNSLVAIFAGITGVALIAVLVSKNSNTTGVVGSVFGGYSSALATAVSPITGSSTSLYSGITSGNNGNFFS